LYNENNTFIVPPVPSKDEPRNLGFAPVLYELNVIGDPGKPDLLILKVPLNLSPHLKDTISPGTRVDIAV
jgi:hypothetical protein